ncbi:MAG: thioredoxin family protein [Betaproteobacteria bacterium]|nr:thioredoxin family protein [Betaproteobacteria bacterium]
MKSRFLALAIFLPLLMLSGMASALEIQPYAAGTLQQAQAAGKPVALHFHADWCPTCKAQEKAFQSLKADPQLQAATLLVVDYDKERDLRKSLGVRSQSVVIVYKGSRETARVGGETDPAKLKAAIASAL